jgi:hypothetical protein
MRPDRRGAGRAAADEREQRRAAAAAAAQKSRTAGTGGGGGGGGGRKALAVAPNVQVLATPHAKRRRPPSSSSTTKAARMGGAAAELSEAEHDLVPQSSAVRSTPAVAFAPTTAVAETPSRRRAASPDRVPPSSADFPTPAPRLALTRPDADLLLSTPCKPSGGLRAPLAHIDEEEAVVAGTPVAVPSVRLAAAVPATPVKRDGGPGSIYDALGWNDYVVDD